MTAAAFQTAYEDARPFSPMVPHDSALVRAPRSGSWPAPDMTILTGGRTTPPVMPTDIFGSLWPLIRDLAAGAGAPVDYVAVGVLGVVASLVGAKRRVHPAHRRWQSRHAASRRHPSDEHCGGAPSAATTRRDQGVGRRGQDVRASGAGDQRAGVGSDVPGRCSADRPGGGGTVATRGSRSAGRLPAPRYSPVRLSALPALPGE